MAHIDDSFKTDVELPCINIIEYLFNSTAEEVNANCQDIKSKIINDIPRRCKTCWRE